MKEINLIRFIPLNNPIINEGIFNDWIDYDPNCRYLNFSMSSLDHYRYMGYDRNRHDPHDGSIHHHSEQGTYDCRSLERHLISCWSIEEEINKDDLYKKFIGEGKPGIFLFSTNERIKEMLEKTLLGYKIEHSPVNYYDTKESFEENCKKEPVICKKTIFQDEHEYRFWIKQPKDWQLNQIFFSVDPSFLTGYRLINPTTHITPYFLVKKIPAK